MIKYSWRYEHLPKIKSYMHIRMYMYAFSTWTSKLVKGESHLGQLTSWLVASSMRRKSFLVTTNKLQIWSVWIVLVCICLECNLLKIKLPTYLPTYGFDSETEDSLAQLQGAETPLFLVTLKLGHISMNYLNYCLAICKHTFALIIFYSCKFQLIFKYLLH